MAVFIIILWSISKKMKSQDRTSITRINEQNNTSDKASMFGVIKRTHTKTLPYESVCMANMIGKPVNAGYIYIRPNLKKHH